MFVKIFLLLIIIFNLGLPLNHNFDIIILGIILLLFISISKTISLKKIIINKKYHILAILSLTIINLFIPKLDIQEAHSIFLNNKDIKIISNFLPKNIVDDISEDYNTNFDKQRLFNSSDREEFKDVQNLDKKKFINNEFAFSTDSLFQKNKYSRTTNFINFSSREDLRIGQLNSLTYNLPFDKDFRRILPYYVIFEIPKIAKNSKICSNGNFYYFFSKKKLNFDELSEQNFIKNKKNKCFVLPNKYEKIYLIGYSINNKDNLSIKLIKNTYLKIIYLLSALLSISIIFFSIFSFFKIKFSTNAWVYFTSYISTLILTLIRDPSLFTGLRYYRGGADGLLHYSLGRDIVENIYNNNFILALRGGEDIFYFMPGLRYFSGINNIIFGETTFGYFIACTFIPLVIYKILKLLTSKKYAFYLTFSFIFLPIFENMGFGHFNYVWQFARHHAESLSILMILTSLFLILSYSLKEKRYPLNIIFIIGIFLSLSSILRPNFIFTTTLLFLYLSFYFLKKKNYQNLILINFSYAPVFLCMLHNFYFGKELVLFTNAYVAQNFPISVENLKLGLKNLILFNFNNEDLILILNQLSTWNPLYNIHRLLMLCAIVFFTFKRKQTALIYFLLIACFSQHLFLIISSPSSRYAYLAWLLTFIIFIKMYYDNQLFHNLFKKFKIK